jgi:YHS domain-containing protein
MRNLITTAFALSLLVLACGGGAAEGTSPATPKAEGAATSGAVKPNGEATIGDKTTCPISKEVFTVSATSPKAEYKGKTYYFCCGGCDGKFKENPEKYIGASATPAP